jgi:hypothetical protein
MPIWQPRFRDFNVWTEDKRIEKLRYTHWHPVRRGLVEEPEQWRWSSYLSYASGEVGPVRRSRGPGGAGVQKVVFVIFFTPAIRSPT